MFYDIGIYFEANGHGTVRFFENDEKRKKLKLSNLQGFVQRSTEGKR